MITYPFQCTYICDTDAERLSLTSMFDEMCCVCVKETGLSYFYHGDGIFSDPIGGSSSSVIVNNITVVVPYGLLFYSTTVVDALVTPSSKIVIQHGDYAMTDENCVDGINMWVVAGSGSFNLFVTSSNNNSFGGNFKFKYFL